MADVEANGRADAVFAFPGQGLWIWSDMNAWNLLHPFTPEDVGSGRLDNY